MILGQPSGKAHVATGGTLEMRFSPEADGLVDGNVSLAADYLLFLSNNGYPVIPSEVLMLKDSRHISSDEKDSITNHVAESAERRIIVTSGTYAMDSIGKRIKAHPNMRTNRAGKAVAMVSSIIPLYGFVMSDAGFNLGMASAVLEDIDPKVSPVVGVASGIVAPIDTMEKDLKNATYGNVDKGSSLLGYDYYTLVPAGGTIDFMPNGLDGVEPAKTSLIPKYLREHVRSSMGFHSTPPILKDSRNMTDEDRDMVVDLVREAPTEFVIVTSGILRMADLRTRLNEALSNGDDHDRHRKVILTGSRFILGSLDRTDATFNLGYAHGKLGSVGPGAHIALAGRLMSDNENPLPYVYTDEELAAISI